MEESVERNEEENKKAEMEEKERRAVEEMRGVVKRVRTNTFSSGSETDTMAAAEMDTMDTMAERETVATAAVESNVEVAEKDDEERGEGWRRMGTRRSVQGSTRSIGTTRVGIRSGLG